MYGAQLYLKTGPSTRGVSAVNNRINYDIDILHYTYSQLLDEDSVFSAYGKFLVQEYILLHNSKAPARTHKVHMWTKNTK